jgi:hypothetical protein
MTIRNLKLMGLIYWIPSREGVRKQLRNGRGVLCAMFSEKSFQNSDCYCFINTSLQPHSLPAPSQEGNKNQMADNHRKSNSYTDYSLSALCILLLAFVKNKLLLNG